MAPNKKIIYNDIKKKVYETITKYMEVYHMTKSNKITDTMNLQNDLGFDSLSVADITMRMERKLNIQIQDEIANTITTVGDLVQCMYDQESYYKEKSKTIANTQKSAPAKKTPQPIHMVRRNNTTIEFRKGDKTLSLNDPKVSAILERIKQELEHLK